MDINPRLDVVLHVCVNTPKSTNAEANKRMLQCRASFFTISRASIAPYIRKTERSEVSTSVVLHPLQLPGIKLRPTVPRTTGWSSLRFVFESEMAITLNIPPSVPNLPTQSFVGFDGSINGGLCRLANSQSIVFAIGPTVVIRDINEWSGQSDIFLTGHTGTVSALSCSPDGNYIASGQVAHLGFHASVCIFDVRTRERVHTLNLHRGRVIAIAWSPCGKFVASLGGKDDNSVVVWDATSGRPVCGGPAATATALCLQFYRRDSTRLVTAGMGGIRLWEIDVEARRATPRDVPLAGLTRVVQCLAVSDDDSTVYAGTTSGDVLAVQIEGPLVVKAQGPAKKPLSQGVTSLVVTRRGTLLAGSGGGKVVLMSASTLAVSHSATLNGSVTSLAVDNDTVGYWCGTDRGCLYTLSGKTFKEDLRLTCHSDRVNCVVFPAQSSAVFATCSGPDIRVWRTRTGEVLLRLTVPGLECNCLTITPDGTQILTGWSDGTVRAFGPESGRFLFIVHDAHKTSGIKRLSGTHCGVTALASSPDSARMVTGGADGQVRIWAVRQEQRVLEATLKEHKGTVNAIAVSPRLPEIASASDDGTVILWDLIRRVRRNVIYAQTYFRSVQYLGDGSQLVATGSDRRITFYESGQCECIRSLEGSKKGEVAALSLSQDGSFFVTGGADGILKVWDYDGGNVIAKADGAHVTSVAISPDNEYVVAGSADGGVFVFGTGPLEGARREHAGEAEEEGEENDEPDNEDGASVPPSEE